jgi:hypothetical protein
MRVQVKIEHPAVVPSTMNQQICGIGIILCEMLMDILHLTSRAELLLAKVIQIMENNALSGRRAGIAGG